MNVGRVVGLGRGQQDWGEGSKTGERVVDIELDEENCGSVTYLVTSVPSAGGDLILTCVLVYVHKAV